MSKPTVHFVVMGVSGCGKTTAAVALQQHYRCPYAEGDDFHSQANRDKMGSGIPLTDEDRYPWLRSLRDWMSSQAQSGEAVSVVTCSALKREYRDILREAEGKVVFIHLAPPHDVNLERMMARKGHYMKADMLASQLEILEDLQADEEGVRIDSADSAEDVQAEIISWIKAQNFV
ncbi:gluconokinase [Neisseria dumasiana]|uniref:Gluconokinase n=1 Tax=Neisseria dumasiana TaxID=1931275 RepID=A0ABX3WJ24_9NEIS|nr:gluconokinase, GntK/IdnK-type [Neisseria dumasiana]OSI32004.1 gluconokinase [Neisseria dumasiana]UOO84757.1 gluconokinase, GntK/IdnK-type [Neisseria dumasiana]